MILPHFQNNKGKGLKSKPRLSRNASQISDTQVFDWVPQGYPARLCRVLELVMVTNAVNLVPAIIQKHFEHFP